MPIFLYNRVMASTMDYLEYVLFQLRDLDDIRYRAMMGEFILYYQDKIVGGIYDNRFLVKVTPSSLSHMRKVQYEIPYPTGKEMLLVDDVDDAEYVCELCRKMVKELPLSKRRK